MQCICVINVAIVHNLNRSKQKTWKLVQRNSGIDARMVQEQMDRQIAQQPEDNLIKVNI